MTESLKVLYICTEYYKYANSLAVSAQDNCLKIVC